MGVTRQSLDTFGLRVKFTIAWAILVGVLGGLMGWQYQVRTMPAVEARYFGSYLRGAGLTAVGLEGIKPGQKLAAVLVHQAIKTRFPDTAKSIERSAALVFVFWPLLGIVVVFGARALPAVVKRK